MSYLIGQTETAAKQLDVEITQAPVRFHVGVPGFSASIPLTSPKRIVTATALGTFFGLTLGLATYRAYRNAKK